MADDESTRGNDDTPPADPKEGSSKGTEHKKEQSLSPQDTEAIIDGLFKRLKESGAIPVNRGPTADTSGNAGQYLFYQAGNLYTSKD